LERSIRKRKKFTASITNWVTLAVSVATVVAALSMLIDPSKFWIFGMLGLLFPYLFLGSLVLLIVYIYKRNRYLYIPLIAVAVGLFRLPLIFQMDGSNGRPDSVTTEEEIKVMSFNVRVFDLYNWSRNYDTRERIFNFIESEAPDILCLQEFYSSDKGDFNNRELIKQRLGYKYDHVSYSITLHETDHWGIATFSKYPITNRGAIGFEDSDANTCVYTDVINGAGDTIRIYNTHLQSVRFDNDDYRFIESLGGDEEEPDKVSRTRVIFSRLRYAFSKRALQASEISTHINSSPYPSVLCGDFNDTPVSYTYKTLSTGLTDAFRESGTGFGSTYAGPIPGLRIDYILHTSDITSYDFNTSQPELSDHYPVTCYIALER
jgi:endonuclease/exonuclease/phosphatase family metal-dependent hydrolase